MTERRARQRAKIAARVARERAARKGVPKETREVTPEILRFRESQRVNDEERCPACGRGGLLGPCDLDDCVKRDGEALQRAYENPAPPPPQWGPPLLYDELMAVMDFMRLRGFMASYLEGFMHAADTRSDDERGFSVVRRPEGVEVADDPQGLMAQVDGLLSDGCLDAVDSLCDWYRSTRALDMAVAILAVTLPVKSKLKNRARLYEWTWQAVADRGEDPALELSGLE